MLLKKWNGTLQNILLFQDYGAHGLSFRPAEEQLHFEHCFRKFKANVIQPVHCVHVSSNHLRKNANKGGTMMYDMHVYYTVIVTRALVKEIIRSRGNYFRNNC